MDRIIREHHAGPSALDVPDSSPCPPATPCGVNPACVLFTPDMAAFTDAIGTMTTDFARR